LTDLELNPLVIVQRRDPTNLGMVDEQIFSATVGGDKAKAPIVVEHFDGSLCHALNFRMLADLEGHTAASLPDAGLTLVRTVGSGVVLLAAPLASQGSSASSAAYGVTSPRPARRPGRIAHGRNRFCVSATYSKAPGFCTVGQNLRCPTGVTPVPPMHRRATAALCRVIAQRPPTVPPVLVGVRKPGEARPGGEGAVMWEDEPMTDRPTCRRCGHLRVCHRRGRCEYVQRSGWVPSHNTFTTEVPCECEGWQEPK
jgi:hypothetical protein